MQTTPLFLPRSSAILPFWERTLLSGQVSTRIFRACIGLLRKMLNFRARELSWLRPIVVIMVVKVSVVLTGMLAHYYTSNDYYQVRKTKDFSRRSSLSLKERWRSKYLFHFSSRSRSRLIFSSLFSTRLSWLSLLASLFYLDSFSYSLCRFWKALSSLSRRFTSASSFFSSTVLTALTTSVWVGLRFFKRF
jgi:hypothetical protein